jgi:formylglycine-generating enzyme required for sulfatase activity
MQLRLILMMVTAAFAMCLSSAGAVMAQSEKEIANSIGMKLVLIPKGTFQMGSPESEEGREKGEVQHEVTLSKDFYLGVTEITQAQYQKVMGKNPSYFWGDRVAERHPQTGRVIKEVESSNHPVEQVSWEDAVEFCKKLSDLPQEKAAGRVYRLPTEAEWEYACRAGSKSAYSFGDERDSLDDYAWYGENGDGKTHPVGQKKPNGWGLYDMHGNVWEWCNDWYGDYPKGAVSDPVGPREPALASGFPKSAASRQPGSYRVFRGGCWYVVAANCRSAFRCGNFPSYLFSDFRGFRVALSPSGIPK